MPAPIIVTIQDSYAIICYRSSHDSKLIEDSRVVELEELQGVQGFGGSNLRAAMLKAREVMQQLQQQQQHGGASMFWGSSNKGNRSSTTAPCSTVRGPAQRYILLSDGALRHDDLHPPHEQGLSYPSSRHQSVDLQQQTVLRVIADEAEQDSYTMVFGIAMQ